MRPTFLYKSSISSESSTDHMRSYSYYGRRWKPALKVLRKEFWSQCAMVIFWLESIVVYMAVASSLAFNNRANILHWKEVNCLFWCSSTTAVAMALLCVVRATDGTLRTTIIQDSPAYMWEYSYTLSYVGKCAPFPPAVGKKDTGQSPPCGHETGNFSTGRSGRPYLNVE